MPEQGFHLTRTLVGIQHLEGALATQCYCRAPEPRARLLAATERLLGRSKHSRDANEPIGLLRRQGTKLSAVSQGFARQHNPIQLRSRQTTTIQNELNRTDRQAAAYELDQVHSCP